MFEIKEKIKKTGIMAEAEKSKANGFIAIPFFREKNPIELAKQMEKKFSKLKYIEKAEAKGPYLNLYLNHKKLLKKKEKKNHEGKKILIEFSSPNTNKPLHLGHLRNDFLGMFLSNLYEQNGNKVIRANLLNDRGLAMAKTMLALKIHKGSPKKNGMKPDHFIGYLYTQYAKDVEKNPNLEKKARKLILDLENKDKRALKLWKKITDWAIKGYKETYKRIGTKFDIVYRESEFYKQAEEIIKEGLEKGIFVKDGTIKAKLEPELPDKVLKREDGTSLYVTNDLYVTKKRFNDYNPDLHLWVVASEQNLYFKQLIAIFQKLEYDFANKLEHVPYGLVNLPTGRMKSREGTVIDADNLLDELKEIAEKELEKRNSPKQRAELISLSALKFAFLKTDKNKDILYNPEESIKFEGETGPYLLYTYARAKSILRKSKKKPKLEKEKIEEKERKLLDLFIEQGKALEESLEFKSPHPLAQYLISLAEEFNSLYHEEKFIDSEKEEYYLYLTKKTAEILKENLKLLGIKTLEEM